MIFKGHCFQILPVVTDYRGYCRTPFPVLEINLRACVAVILNSARLRFEPQSRDVTKFEFKFDNVRTSNVFNRLEIWRMFKCLVVVCKFVEKSLFRDWFG